MGAQQLLDRLPEKLRQNGLVRLASPAEMPSIDGRPLGEAAPTTSLPSAPRPGTLPLLSGAEARLPHAERLHAEAQHPDAQRAELLGLVSPGLHELPLERGDSLGTELGLYLASELQRAPSRPWVAFVDPLGTLHAPGVSSRGVRLERLLVLRPRQEARRRVLVRLVESEIFSLVVADLAGTPTEPIEEHLGGWVRVTRRLLLALRGQSQRVLLLTNQEAKRPLPLAVSRRLDAARVSALFRR